MANNQFSAQDFLKNFSANTLSPPVSITGMVKPVEDDPKLSAFPLPAAAAG